MGCFIPSNLTASPPAPRQTSLAGTWLPRKGAAGHRRALVGSLTVRVNGTASQACKAVASGH